MKRNPESSVTPIDSVLQYGTSGVLTPDQAVELKSLPTKVRLGLAAEAVGFLETHYTDAEAARLNWLAKQLGRETIPDNFIRIVAAPASMNTTDGLNVIMGTPINGGNGLWY